MTIVEQTCNELTRCVCIAICQFINDSHVSVMTPDSIHEKLCSARTKGASLRRKVGKRISFLPENDLSIDL